MATTTGRRLELLVLLQARPGVRADELAARLGVTERTARRDIAQLRELGYRIDGQAGRHGGYRLASGPSNPALMLDEDELLAVAVGLRSATGVSGLELAAATAMAKVAAIVPARLHHRLGALAGIAPATVERQRRVDADVLVALALACRQREAVRIRRHVDERPRVLQPHQLVPLAETWYLVACEQGKGDWRTWALDRIQRVELLATSVAAPPPPEDAVEFVTRSLARGRRHSVRLRVHAAADVVRRVVPATVAEVIDDGATCELRLATDDLDAAARWVSFLSVDVDVLEPDELRERIASHGARLAARHGGGSDGGGPG